jgi:serine/threonine protein kinase
MYETSFYLVLEFCDHELGDLLSNSNVTITVAEIKNLMLQLLHGLCYVHSNEVCIDSKVRISEFCESDISDIYHNQLLNITPENNQQATTSVLQCT